MLAHERVDARRLTVTLDADNDPPIVMGSLARALLDYLRAAARRG